MPDLSVLRQLSIDEVAFVDKGAGGNRKTPVKIAIFKRRKENGDYDDDEENSNMDLESILAELGEEKSKVIQAALAAAATKQEEDDEEEKQDEEEEEEEKQDEEEEEEEKQDEEEEEEEEAKAMKALPASLRKRFRAERDQRIDLAKRLAQMEEKAEISKFEKRAERFSLVPAISKKQLGSILRACHKSLSASDVKALEQSLSATNEIVEKSAVFGEAGSSNRGASSGDAIGKLRGIAKALQAASPNMSDESAFTKAVEMNPELHAEHIAERRGSRN